MSKLKVKNEIELNYSLYSKVITYKELRIQSILELPNETLMLKYIWKTLI